MAEQVQPDVDMGLVVKNIYTACDLDCRNSARVSGLIDYITPFMGESMSDLMELKLMLDPNNDDPEITSEQFYKVMAEWTQKFNDHSSSFHNISVEHLSVIEDRDLPFIQSTPRASFGNKLKKGTVDVGILNASLLSNQSVPDSGTGPTGLEKSYYEDQINELTHQNRKCADELLHIKLQLVNTEEQNDVLQADLDRLKKQLVHEREIIEALQNERRDFEELRETSSNAQRQADRAEKKLQAVERENQQLKQEISKLEREKQQSEEKISNMHKKVSEKVTVIVELETEMKVKDQDLAHLEDVNNNLMQRLDEHKKMIDDYQESTRCMQVEKEKLQKMLKERMKKPSKISKTQTFGEYKRCSLPPSTITPTPIPPPLPANTTTSTQPPLPPKKQQQQNTEHEDLPFTSAIKTDAFNFFNYESPFARMKRRSVPLSPLAKTDSTPGKNIPETITHTQIKNKSEYSIITKMILDNSLPDDLGGKLLEPTKVSPGGSCCKDVVLYDFFKTPVKGDEGFESPPSMYVVPCSNSLTPPTATYKADPILTSPNVSTFSINDSSDDEISRLQVAQFGNYSPRESLKSEMSQAITNDENYDENAGKSDYENRISYLECELKQHQRDNNRLNFEKLKLENDVNLGKIKQLEIDNENVENQVGHFEAQLKMLQHENETFAKRNDELTDKKVELERCLRNKKDEFEELERCLSKSHEEKDELQRSTSVLQAEKEGFERRLNALQEENDKLQRSVKVLREEKDELERYVDVLQEEKDGFETRLNSTRGEKVEYETRLKAIQSENDEFEERFKAIQSEKDELERCLDATRDETQKGLNKLGGNLKDENDRIAVGERISRSEFESLKEENENALSEMEPLKNEKERISEWMRSEIELLKNEKERIGEEMRSEIESLKIENERNGEKMRSKIESLKEKMHSANESLKDETVKTRRLNAEIERIKKWLDEARLKNDEFNKSINRLSQENRILGEENAGLIKENETLNNSLRKQIDALNLKETAFEAETCDLQRQVERIKSAYDDLKIDLERIKSNNLEEIKVLQRNLAELIDQRESLENDKDSLEKVRIEFETENDYLKDRVDRLEGGLREKVDVVKTLEGQLRDKVDVVKNLEGQLREKESVIEGLNEVSLESNKWQKDKENAYINGEIMLKQKVEELEDKVRLICAEKTALETTNAVNAEKLKTVTDEVERIKSEKNQTKSDEEFDALKDALAVSRRETKHLQQRLKSFDEKSKRGVNHDKMQMKLEKHIEKIDYLEEQLRNEREEKLQINREMRAKNEKYMADIMSIGTELDENRRCLRRSSEFLLKKWRHHLEKFPLMEDVLDQFDNGWAESNYLDLMGLPLNEELISLKQEIKLVESLMENLGNTSLLDKYEDSSLITKSTNRFQIQNKFLLKPPTLVLKPMSPDSPNLELNTPKYETPPHKTDNGEMSPDSRADSLLTTTRIGAGDVSAETFTSASTSTDGFLMRDFQDESISLYEEAAEDGVFPSPIIKLDRVYEEKEDVILSEEDLAERFTVCVSEFTIERKTIKERLEAHYEQIRETELNLSAATKGVMNLMRAALQDSNAQQGETLIQNIVSSVCHLCRLAEQFGAMKRECGRAASLAIMITHMTNLNLKLESSKRTLCECTGRLTKSVSPVSSLISREVFCSIVMTVMTMSLVFCTFVVWCARSETLDTWEEIFRGFVTKEYRNGPPPI